MRRIAISLDDHAHAELARRAQAAAEPVARVAARFVRDGLLGQNGTCEPSLAVSPHEEGQAVAYPVWLEPQPEGGERWRRETWAAVCALHERYSAQLQRLARDWWQDRSLVERLSALCAWRAGLDAGSADDPRAELLFHDRLEILERQLKARRDHAGRFTGGPPPAEWLGG